MEVGRYLARPTGCANLMAISKDAGGSTLLFFAMLPAYAFIKTHKVGGTTVTQMLRSALAETKNATLCDRPHQSTQATRGPPAECRACLTHVSYKQIAVALRSPTLPAAQSVVQRVCPFWVAGRRVHTMIMLREPVDRVYSRYYYELSDGWCRRKANALGLQGCASDNYTFIDWAFAPTAELVARRLFRQSPPDMFAETVQTLGASEGVKKALRVLKSIEVVGITSRFNETLRVLSSTWGLPERSLRAHFIHKNQGVKPTDTLNTSCVLSMRTRSYWLRAEYTLYEYAFQHLTLASAALSM